MKTIYGELMYISSYNEGYFILEQNDNTRWICFLINKEDEWDILYELMHYNKKVSCCIEEECGIKDNTHIVKVIL